MMLMMLIDAFYVKLENQKGLLEDIFKVFPLLRLTDAAAFTMGYDVLCRCVDTSIMQTTTRPADLCKCRAEARGIL